GFGTSLRPGTAAGAAWVALGAGKGLARAATAWRARPSAIIGADIVVWCRAECEGVAEKARLRTGRRGQERQAAPVRLAAPQEQAQGARGLVHDARIRNGADQAQFLRLIASSNFVGCSMGRSAGLAPLRILST